MKPIEKYDRIHQYNNQNYILKEYQQDNGNNNIQDLFLNYKHISGWHLLLKNLRFVGAIVHIGTCVTKHQEPIPQTEKYPFFLFAEPKYLFYNAMRNIKLITINKRKKEEEK